MIIGRLANISQSESTALGKTPWTEHLLEMVEVYSNFFTILTKKQPHDGLDGNAQDGGLRGRPLRDFLKRPEKGDQKVRCDSKRKYEVTRCLRYSSG